MRNNILLIALLLSSVISIAQNPTFLKQPSSLSYKLLNNTSLITEVYKDSTYTLTHDVQVNELSYLSNKGNIMKAFVYTINLKNPNISIATTLPNNELTFAMQPMTEQAKSAYNPFYTIIGGVNGDFYNMKTGEPEGIFVSHGIHLKTTYTDRIKGFLAIDKHNKVQLIDINQFSQYLPTIQHAVSGGDWLVKDNKVISQVNQDVHPRTAVALTDTNQLIFVVIDGRNPTWSNGTNLEDLGTFLQGIGASKALNLDGGGSSTFFINPNLKNNEYLIRNLPSDKNNKERAVSNGLIITQTR